MTAAPEPTQNGAPPKQPEVAAPVAATPRGRGLLAALRRLGRELGTLLGYEHLPQLAAALAYRTIFSLVPLTLVALLFVRLFSNPDSLIKNFLQGVLKQAGLSQIATDQGFDFTSWITDMVAKFKGLDFTLLGVFSFALLIYAAISLLVEVESALNRVYGVTRARTWVQRFLQYWMIVTIGPVLVAASFVVADYFARLATEVAAVNGGASWGPWVTSLAAFVIPACISALLLLVMYMVVPNTRVRFVAALVGALVAACLFELAKSAFGTYLRQETYKTFYGTLALLPLFLLWIYVLWIIVLFGLRIAFMIQHRRMWVLWTAWRGTALGQVIVQGLNPHSQAEAGAPPGIAWVDPTTLISVVAEVGRRFAHGRPSAPTHIAERLGLDESIVSRALDQLARGGVIHSVADPSDCYALSRPAEQILLSDVLLLGYQLLNAVRPGSEPPAVFDLRQAQVEAGRSRTLADVIGPMRTLTATPPASAPAPAGLPTASGR